MVAKPRRDEMRHKLRKGNKGTPGAVIECQAMPLSKCARRRKEKKGRRKLSYNTRDAHSKPLSTHRTRRDRHMMEEEKEIAGQRGNDQASQDELDELSLARTTREASIHGLAIATILFGPITTRRLMVGLVHVRQGAPRVHSPQARDDLPSRRSRPMWNNGPWKRKRMPTRVVS